MDKTTRIVDVGAVDESKKTSPIVDETSVDVDVTPTIVPGEAVCWFNDQQFEHDEMVYSGNDILRCDSGAWIRSGRRMG